MPLAPSLESALASRYDNQTVSVSGVVPFPQSALDAAQGRGLEERAETLRRSATLHEALVLRRIATFLQTLHGSHRLILHNTSPASFVIRDLPVGAARELGKDPAITLLEHFPVHRAS